MKENETDNKKIKKALLKKALGYDSKEVIEEYVSCDEGEIKLSKKKITTKEVPPDITALKILMDEETEKEDLTSLTDEELEKEKQRIIEMIKKEK